MAAFQQVAGGQVAAVSVVDAHVVVIVVVAVAVDQDDRDLGLFHLAVKFIGVHADDDDAVQIALLRQGQVALAHVGGRDDDVVTVLPGVQLDAAQDLAVKIVLEHEPAARLGLGDHDPDEPGAALGHGEGAGGEIGHIAQFVDCGQHTALGLPGDGFFIVEHVRNCGRGDARPGGDVF